MRVPHFLTLFVGLIAMTTLFGCSRESSVKENVSLRNNHSRVFAFKEPIENPQAFADSMANTPVSETDSIPDTLTVTVNDTVYLIGLLPYNVDKIYAFQWVLAQKKQDKVVDTTIATNNATPQKWVFTKDSVYYPLFIAIDGNNTTDTAGSATKKTFIRVIDTKPSLTVPKDTLWTRHKGDITFPILASDSFGTITSIMVDLDASDKKDSARVWKYETREDNDSLYITIKNDSTRIDKLGNQKIYVIVTDDDGNETKDSVNLHFNRLPRLKVIYPQDGARHNIDDRFYFYYEGEDDDNPQDLKYFIRAQVSTNGQPPQKAFTDNDLIVANFTSNIFEPRDSQDSNYITLLKDPSTRLTGRIYWDMYVKDGYDEVYIDRIKTSDNLSRPWNFYIGNLSSSQGTFTGVAKYQGLSNHSDIRIEFSNDNKIFDVVTKDSTGKGNYTVIVNSGTYSVKAFSETRKEYTTETLKDSIFIESGATIRIDPIELKDTVKPMLIVKNIDTLTTRSFTQTIYARDLGSRLESVKAELDGKNISFSSSCKMLEESSIFNCQFDSNVLSDGMHNITYMAKDSAGNVNTLKQTIAVMATKLTLDVNGAKNARIGEGNQLVFTASVSDAVPAPKNVNWSWTSETGEIFVQTDVDENGNATLSYNFDNLKNIVTAGNEYVMTASYTENGANVSAQVKFGILGDKPSIIFTEPIFDDTVSLNDAVLFKAVTYKGSSSTDMHIKWSCTNSDKLSAGYTCPANDTKEASIAYKAAGTYTITAIVTDQDEKADTTSSKIIVISDSPTIKATTNDNTNEYKINSVVNVNISASDKFGTINKIEWGCSNGNVSFDYHKDIDPPTASVSDISLNVTLPGTESKNHHCVFKATDDDGEVGYDTLYFTTLLDLPTVRLATKSDVVTIKSKQFIKAIANDVLGKITKYEYACSDNLPDLDNPDWTLMAKAQDSVTMPSTPTSAYYCVVQVTDDDNNTARDMVTYTVIAGLPTVTPVVDYDRVTIKDTVDLNAFARDTLNGYIIKYEWGCGSASSTDIEYTYVSEKKGSTQATPHTKMVMPSEAQDGYKCLIRVTDNDNNTVIGSVKIDIIQAPPTITIPNKDKMGPAREGFSIRLKAEASDNNNVPTDPGSIVKREWSCGTPSEIKSHWTTVSDFDTIWTAPAQQDVYYCIARATDNDGNQASDTLRISFTNELPTIEVVDSLIYVNPGDPFELDARINTAWQGIDWFKWECRYKDNSNLVKPSDTTKWSYEGNHGSFKIGKDSSYSTNGKDMLCSISAKESSSADTLSSTTEVRIIKFHPEGVISAGDTVYLWSGDESVEDDAKYFYTPDWNGKKSKGGELKDPNNKYEYWWNFSNVDGNFYQGRTDGSIDTAIREINPAFIRSNYEGSMTIKLDFLDSIGPHTQAFYSRHRAEIASHTVYFRKAWKNLVKETKDTVIAQTKATTSPVMIMHNNMPTLAYVDDNNNAVVTNYANGAWNTLGTITGATAPISSLQLTTDGSNLYLGVLENSGKYSLYKSFTKIGNSLENVAQAKVLTKGSAASPVLIYLGIDKTVYLAELNNNSWKNNSTFGTLKKIFRCKNQNNQEGNCNIKYREFDATFANNNLTIVAVADTSSYTGYKFVFNSNYENKNAEKIEDDMSKITLLANSSTLYMGFENRNQDKYGPYVYKGTFSNTYDLTFNKGGIFGKPIKEGPMAAHISLTVSNSILYAAFDDREKASNAQVHVYKLDGDRWLLHGENQLPYFSSAFYKANKYYLRGYSPMLATDNNGSIYVSMSTLESAYDETHTVKNNGPLVMKYVADNWEIK